MADPARADARFDVGLRAAGRYEIVRFIASGGMGEVYAARDLVLDTTVALKTLKPELQGSSTALERFRREIALARTVTDPHVCRLHDVGEHEGRVFLTMELLDGSPLAGPHPIDRVERLAPQLVHGLAALHAAGIVHRDFKTANVIVVGDRAVITDFGLARAADATDSSITIDSGLIGTPAYMAPEQVEGRPATPASDVYALGVVLFELLTGTLPFREDTAMATATARLHRDPPAPSSVRADVPPAWDTIVARCLARDPAARPHVIDVLAPPARSRRWFLAAGAVGAAGAAFGIWRWRRGSTPQLAPNAAIAVLPVGDASTLWQDPWRVALTFDIHDRLTSIGAPVIDLHPPAMGWRTPGTALRWARAPDPLAVAFEFPHVAAVVQSELERGAERATLVLRFATRDGAREERITRRLGEVSLLANDAARAIAERFGRPTPRPTPPLPADVYERYGTGVATLFREPTPDERAGAEAGTWHRYDALATFAEATPHALAAAFVAERIQAQEEQEEFDKLRVALDRADAWVRRALAVDAECALAHAVRGHGAMLRWDWSAADVSTRRAAELAPTHGRVGYHRNFFLLLQGRFDELLARIEREYRFAPDERLGEARLGYHFYYARRFSDAIRVMAPKLDAFDLHDFLDAVGASMLALSYAELGRDREALAVADRLRAAKVDDYVLAGLVPVYTMAGRIAEARALRAEVGPRVDAGVVAIMADGVGDYDAALAALEQVVASHNIHALFLKIERYSGALRAQPRFQALMQQVGFG